MNNHDGIAIRVPDVRPDESGPRDAESRTVGSHPAFQRLVRESRARRAAGDRGISVDEALAEADTESADNKARVSTGTRSLSAAWSALLTQFVDRSYAETERGVERIGDIADLPLDALQGVSKADAEAIRRAFGVRTIRQLAEHRLVRAAQALTLLVDQNAS